jgi:hypothetical protein
MEWMQSEAFTAGVQIAQSVMLFVCGYMLLNGIRIVKRGIRIVQQQQKLMDEMLDLLRFQVGIIITLQAGVIAPWHLKPIDLRNLPIEIRLKILYALIAVGVEHYHGRQPSEGTGSNGSVKVDEPDAEGP